MNRHLGIKNRIAKKHKFNGTAVIATGFIAIIALGTLLLMLPISSQSGQFTDPLTAGFTSVSATCVTGLVAVDTGSYWSAFGQAVIILLIQVGGLGFMTVAVLAALLFGRNVTPQDRMLVAASYNLNTSDSVLSLVRKIALGTVTVEGIGAIILAARFVPEFGLGRGIWMGVFTSISAFCNAGFDILGNGFASLTEYAADPVINVTIMALVVIGGIGFIVWSDLWQLFTKRKRLSVYSRLVLIITAVLLVLGTVLFAAFEWNNPATLGGLGTGEKIMAASFQSVTLRTAGFCTVDNGALTDASVLLGILLMFVGGASGSTAGGVKIVTVGIIVYTIWSVIRGKKEIVVFGRTIDSDSFTKATATFAMQLLLIVIGTVGIMLTSGQGLAEIAYEVTSAVNTVGISMGLTPAFGALPKIFLMILMYVGRVGFFTVTCAVMSRFNRPPTSLTYPRTNILIG
jgi:trk system potassium uptake protein TrkH